MKMLIFLLHCWVIVCHVIFGARSQKTTIPLCCPIGWTLAKLKISIFHADKYDCMNATQAEKLKNEVEILGKILPLGGYQIQNPSNFSKIPNCQQPRLQIFPTNVRFEITSNTCLARFDSRIAGISCYPDHNEQMQYLSFMHKCCPIDYIYDAAQRKCIAARHHSSHRSIAYNIYANFFEHDNVVFIDDAMECPRDKVLVEYRLKSRDFKFDNNKLIILYPDRQNVFDLENYCVEAIVLNDSKKSSIDAAIDYDRIESNVGSNGSNIFFEQLEYVQSINNAAAADRRSKQEYFVRTCTSTEICKQIACIRRCCIDGEMFTKGSATSYCKKDEFDIAFHDFQNLDISGNFSKPEVFGILRSLDCLKYRLDPNSFPDEAHTINSLDGSLYVMQTKKNYTSQQYCVEKVRTATMSDQKLYTFLCFEKKDVANDKIRFRLYPIGLLISCVFYGITLIVYLCISRLRNLPGKILICLVSSLFTAYLSIALGQLMPTSNDDVCFASGFFVYFCLMAAFAWMNVMCFDIWQTFGSTRKNHSLQNDHNKRFLLYSAYGWGLPTTFTVITVSLTKSNVLSENLRPHFGHGRCWFTYDAMGSANLLFFSGPVGILFLTNLALFILTLRYCNRVKREIFRMQSSCCDKPVLKRRFFLEKSRFAMNTKLFVVMGITWLLELLSILFYDHKKTFFWAISDSFNVLQGVFVFFIFVFKKRVWISVQEKFGFHTKDSTRTLQNATFATPSVYGRSTSMSRLNAIDVQTPPPIAAAVNQSPLL